MKNKSQQESKEQIN